MCTDSIMFFGVIIVMKDVKIITQDGVRYILYGDEGIRLPLRIKIVIREDKNYIILTYTGKTARHKIQHGLQHFNLNIYLQYVKDILKVDKIIDYDAMPRVIFNSQIPNTSPLVRRSRTKKGRYEIYVPSLKKNVYVGPLWLAVRKSDRLLKEIMSNNVEYMDILRSRKRFSNIDA